MPTTADRLNLLLQTKEDIKQAIIDKGVEVSDADNFPSYADKISSISSGGGGFNIPDGTSFAYSQWDSIPEWLEDYMNNANNLYHTLEEVSTTDEKELKLISNNNSWINTFDDFEGTNITIDIDCSKGISSSSFVFQAAYCLEIKLSNTETIKSFSQWFWNTACRKISTITFSLTNTVSISQMFHNNYTANYLLMKNIGTPTITANYDLVSANWGIENESYPETLGARQSLIDSLITYSYDRVAHSLENTTISLSTNTKSLLTEEEIAQITAKGFTIA